MAYSYSNIQYRTENRTFVTFRVKATKDAHIGLFDKIYQYIAYEIVLGAGTNTFSVIRRAHQTDDKAYYVGTTLNETDFRAFWISWSNGLIQVGFGNIVGHEMFMSWQDPEPIGIGVVAISGYYDVGGEWEFQAVPGMYYT